MDAQKIVVLKLGGDVVADPRVMRTMIEVVKRHRQSGRGVVIVVSAPRGATPILRARVAAQEESDQISREVDFLKLMRDWMVSMNCESPDRQRAEDAIAGFFIGNKKEESHCPTPDQVLALGEIHAAGIVSGFLERGGLSVGVARVWERGMLTDDRFGSARPLTGADSLLRDVIAPGLKNAQVIVVPGFVGHTADGRITTLGRSGSDLTATIVARAIGASIVEVWKSEMLFTADPRVLKCALPIPFLSLDQASELAAHGMAALHPSAMDPLRGTGTVVYVKSVKTPRISGTRISNRGASMRAAGVTLSPGHVLYTARTGAMVDTPGSVSAASAALNTLGYPVGLIASGQVSFTLSAQVREDMAVQAGSKLPGGLVNHRNETIGGAARREFRGEGGLNVPFLLKSRVTFGPHNAAPSVTFVALGDVNGDVGDIGESFEWQGRRMCWLPEESWRRILENPDDHGPLTCSLLEAGIEIDRAVIAGDVADPLRRLLAAYPD